MTGAGFPPDPVVLPPGPVLPWAAAGAPPPPGGGAEEPGPHAAVADGAGPHAAVADGPGVVLRVDDLSASYGRYRALFGVSLTVADGAIVAVLGPNGAGKSTLARVVSGLVPASAGTVELAGEPITGLPAHQVARRGLVHVPEGRAVFAGLTVEENLVLSFGARLGRGRVRPALERAYGAFPLLAERRRQAAGTLSGGQQRLLSLAKVLAAPARLLVVDELSLGLSPAVVDDVYDGLVAIRAEGTSLLVVEQQVDRAVEIADRAVVLSHGAVVWEGPAAGAPAVVAEDLRRQGGSPADPAPAAAR